MSRKPRSEEELDAVAGMIGEGAVVATGGLLLARKPSALVRALARHRASVAPFHLVTLAGSYDVDLLAAAGLLSGVEASYVGFGGFGFAPTFTQAASSGALEWMPVSEAMLAAALRARLGGLAGHPVPYVAGTDLAAGLSDRDGVPVVEPLAPDVALLHFPFADREGRVLLPVAAGLDLELLAAARRVAVTVDRVVDALPAGGLVVPLPGHADLFEVPFGAHPTSCHPHHTMDAPHLVHWALQALKGQQEGYLRHVDRGEARFRDGAVRPDELQPLTARLPAAGAGRAWIPQGPNLRQVGATPSEVMAWAMAQLIPPGRPVALGLATHLPLVAYLLAREAASIPEAGMAGPPGPLLAGEEGLWTDPPLPASLTMRERSFARRGSSPLSFATLALETLPAMRPVEFLRPAQVDPHGNTNNLVVAAQGAAGERVLPGPAGIPDVTHHNPHLVLYVPRHRPGVFVPRLSALSGKGFSTRKREREMQQRDGRLGPLAVVTDLCVMGFAAGRLQLASLHPGVAMADVERATGFDVMPPEWHGRPGQPLPRTPLPPPAVAEMLRRRVDPLGLREAELMGSADRTARLLEIVVEERRLFHPVSEIVGA